MKITKEIVQRIEGEATLELEWNEGKIDFAKIKFLNFRGIENILEGRPFLDALAITPRVCGICSTSHILASINALENAYENINLKPRTSKKAKAIREIVLNAEKIQNHIKWFIFNIYPELLKLNGEKKFAFEDFLWKKAQKIIAQCVKIAAIFSGQWPHASFCMVGGVTCDPIESDINDALCYLDEVMVFLESEIYGVKLESFLSEEFLSGSISPFSLIGRMIDLMTHFEFQELGKSYDRFIALGDSFLYGEMQKCNSTVNANADIKFVSESLENSFFGENGYTYSKSAVYKNRFYEVGPLARMMIAKDPLIKDFHRKYKDSTLTRVVARMRESAYLVRRTKELLESIDLKEYSCISPKVSYSEITSEGIGIVEAARGTLIHKVQIKKGLIRSYDIITPTVWNLGNGSRKNPSIAQNAIIGIESFEKADFIFKSFDICSVCTTQ